MSERRAFPRWAVSLDCEADHKGTSFRGVIDELSENGLGFVSDRPAEVGDEILMAFNTGAGQSGFKVQCVVRDRKAAHTGVEFLNLTLTDRLRLVHYLSDREVTRSSS